jgi:hypothetical protein
MIRSWSRWGSVMAMTASDHRDEPLHFMVRCAGWMSVAILLGGALDSLLAMRSETVDCHGLSLSVLERFSSRGCAAQRAGSSPRAKPALMV